MFGLFKRKRVKTSLTVERDGEFLSIDELGLYGKCVESSNGRWLAALGTLDCTIDTKKRANRSGKGVVLLKDHELVHTVTGLADPKEVSVCNTGSFAILDYHRDRVDSETCQDLQVYDLNGRVLLAIHLLVNAGLPTLSDDGQHFGFFTYHPTSKRAPGAESGSSVFLYRVADATAVWQISVPCKWPRRLQLNSNKQSIVATCGSKEIQLEQAKAPTNEQMPN